jgi:hypothetical protein
MNEELEMYMADIVQRAAPDDVAEFMEAIQEDGITQAEVDEVRQITLQTLNDPSNYPMFGQYLVDAGLIEAEDLPPSFEIGFVMSILGLIGVAQKLVASS